MIELLSRVPAAAPALALTGIAVAMAVTRQALGAAAAAPSSAERLVAELRLAQFTALLLAFTAAPSIGFAVVAGQPGASFDIAIAATFAAVGALALWRDPRDALTLVAVAFVAHGVLVVAPRPEPWGVSAAPAWYRSGVAIYSVYLGAIAYWPLVRR